MRLISYKKLIDLPVYTKNRQYLGKICGFDIDISNHSIINYHISSSSLVKKILKRELIINFQQVISIDKEKMIVEDETIREYDEAIIPAISKG